MFRLVCNLLAGEIGEGRMFAESPPYRFAMLVEKDEGVWQRGFSHCAAVWGALTALEKHTAHNDALQRFRAQLCLLDQNWPREILIGISEGGGGRLPGPCVDEITAVSQGFLTSKAVEETFNV